MRTELVSLDAVEIAELIHTGQVSCVDVMTEFLDRIDRLNPSVNAIVGMADRAESMRAAEMRDRELARGRSRGWMHGLPIAVKDLSAAKGLLWTEGSPLFADRVAGQDDLIVRRMKAEGAIVVGKTNTPEFGLGSQTYNTVYGTTRNPYDTTRTPGGSSGGAAAALALRMLPVADGSDNMGSLRNPAAFTNVLGFRPSWGRVPHEGFQPQLSTAGPMGRAVADIAALLATLAGQDRGSALCLDGRLTLDGEDVGGTRIPRVPARDFTGTRIGWVGDYDGYLITEPGVLDVCRGALDALERLGCVVQDVAPVFPMSRVWETYLVCRWWGVLGRRDLLSVREHLKPELLWELEHATQLRLSDVDAAVEARAHWYLAVCELFERVDFVVAPSAQVFPFDAATHWPRSIAGRTMDTYHRWMETVVPWTLAGVPVMGMPAGFDARGLPMGVQLIGPPRADLAVLQLAQAYERATHWVRDRPPPA